MNSNYGKSSKSASLNNYEFDFGHTTNRSRSLNDQKNQTPSYSSSSFSSTQPKPNTSSSWQPNKPSWTHQPTPTQSSLPGSSSGPTSMVGDIFGKSWVSSSPSRTTSGIGIVNKNPNLFGDLVSSAIGQNKGNSNVPLKNATPVSASASNKSAYSMGGMADALPKASNSVKSSSNNWGSSTGGYNSSNNFNVGNNNKSQNLGGPSMRGLAGSGAAAAGAGGISTNNDPFGSLADFGSKPAASMKSAGKGSYKTSSVDDSFGDFQDASKSSMPSFPSNAFPSNNNTTNQPPVQSSGVDVFDTLFSSSSASTGAATKGLEELGSQQADNWGWDSEFGGGNDTGGTTELDGLSPPPAGVTASAAKNKGLDNHKQGQYADAIKWLSWAVVLLQKAGDNAGTMEVLSCRASCYKEVGEYKKAVADCTKVLEDDATNVSVLVQRALLYESMEKYKLGAEDLRTVMKIDPGNRVARSTVHRLTKMAE